MKYWRFYSPGPVRFSRYSTNRGHSVRRGSGRPTPLAFDECESESNNRPPRRCGYLIYPSKARPVLRFYCGRLRARRDRACAGRFSAFDLYQTWLYHRFLLTCISPSPARVHDDCQRPFEGRCLHHTPGPTPAGGFVSLHTCPFRPFRIPFIPEN